MTAEPSRDAEPAGTDATSAALEPPLRVQASVATTPRVALFARPTLAAALVAFAALVAEQVPALGMLRLYSSPPRDQSPEASAPLDPAAVPRVGEAELTTESKNRQEMAQPESIELPRAAGGPIATSARELPAIASEAPPVPLEDASGHALDGFFAALRRTQAKERDAVTRIAHFGDSIVVSDYVSGSLRRKFQQDFGDAGHGYMLIANAWPAYFHNDVYRFASPGWKVSRIVGPYNQDGFYGLGGVSFQAPPGARARFGTAQKGSFGRAVSRFTFAYLEDVHAGGFAINLDGKPLRHVAAKAPEKRVAYATVDVPDGEHEIEVVTEGGTTRMFGVVLERRVPGVVLDALGVQGARIRFLDKQDDAHWAEQLAWRKPDLIVYQFGANESGDGFAYPMSEYYKTMVAVLEQGRRALPESSCLVLGAMDRASKKDDTLLSMRVIPMIVTEQRKAAKTVGCAFFDTFEAMKGLGGMPGWVRRGLGQADLTHPTGVGSEIIARWIYRALMTAYNQYAKNARP
ncbi:MAG TPA: hypothetical protein VI197_12880 [Polyangiaceae bacterium]